MRGLSAARFAELHAGYELARRSIEAGFVRFDAGLYATINQNWKAQINVENLFNKGYWASADGNNNISPGQSRTVRVKLTARF